MAIDSLMTAWVDLRIDRTEFDRQLLQIKSELSALKAESLALNNSMRNLAPNTSNFTKELAKGTKELTKGALQATLLANAIKGIANVPNVPKMLSTGGYPAKMLGGGGDPAKMLGSGKIPKMLGSGGDYAQYNSRFNFFPGDYNTSGWFNARKSANQNFYKFAGSSSSVDVGENLKDWRWLRNSQMLQQKGTGFAGSPFNTPNWAFAFSKAYKPSFPATREFINAASADASDIASRARDAMTRAMSKHKSFRMTQQEDGLVKNLLRVVGMEKFTMLGPAVMMAGSAYGGFKLGKYLQREGIIPQGQYNPLMHFSKGGAFVNRNQYYNPADGLVKSWKQLRYEIEATQTKKLDEFAAGFDKAKISLDAYLSDINRARSSASGLSNAFTRLALGGLDTSTTKGSIFAIRERLGSELTQSGESIVAAQDRIREYQRSNLASQSAIDTFMGGLTGNTGKKTILPEEQKIIDERRKLIQDNYTNIQLEEENIKTLMVTRKAIALEEKTNIENMKMAVKERISKENQSYGLNYENTSAKLREAFGDTGMRANDWEQSVYGDRKQYEDRQNAIYERLADITEKHDETMKELNKTQLDLKEAIIESNKANSTVLTPTL